jgi:hypothetical protein
MSDNPLLMRGIERVLIVCVAALFAYLGFRLFALGHTSGPGKLQAKTKLGEVILSGTGPGLFFMAFGGLVLLGAVFHGDTRYSEKTTTTNTEAVSQVTGDQQSGPVSKVREESIEMRKVAPTFRVEREIQAAAKK